MIRKPDHPDKVPDINAGLRKGKPMIPSETIIFCTMANFLFRIHSGCETIFFSSASESWAAHELQKIYHGPFCSALITERF